MFGLIVKAKYVYDTILCEMGLDKQKIEKQIKEFTETKEEDKPVMPLPKKIIIGVLLANNLVILYTLFKYRI